MIQSHLGFCVQVEYDLAYIQMWRQGKWLTDEELTSCSFFHPDAYHVACALETFAEWVRHE